ncbi:MAG: restriction endonuclease subunit S [Candidatus Sedimenticola sp. (ex Thyasira tokunagai)]
MEVEWPNVILNEVTELRNGAGIKQQHFSESGLPLARVSDFTVDSIDLKDCNYVEPEHAKKWSSHYLKFNDVVVATVGSWPPNWSSVVGKVVRVPKHAVGAIQNQNTCCILPLTNVMDQSYLYYRLKLKDFAWHAANSAGGSANQARLPVKKLGDFRFSLPSLSEQKSIAHILGTLDDKIEFNRQMNATLESMAQALFKSWFVDFDPVIDNALAAGNPIPEPLHARSEVRKTLGDQRKPLPEAIQKQLPNRFVFNEEMGWVPEGWDPVKLGDYVTVKRGGSPRPIHDYLVDEGLPWVKISDATASPSRYLMGTKQFIKPEGLKKTVMLKKGALILSNSATPGLPMFLNLDACIHDGWLYFPEKTLYGDLYLYQLFLVVRSELLMQGNGSVFTNLKTDILKNHSVVKPSEVLMSHAEGRFRELHKRSLLIQEETGSLIKIRDSLLPKLLSGQLRITEAEKELADAI